MTMNKYFAPKQVKTEEKTVDVLSLESAHQEIDAAALAAEMPDRDVITMEAVSEELEELTSTMEALIEDGEGLNAQAAGLARGWAQSAMSRLGIEDQPVPSLESFGGETDALEATTVSNEAIKDTISKIWEAIKKAAAKAVRAVRELLAKIFDSADKIKKRANDIGEAAGKKSSNKTEDTIKAANISQLHVKGKYEFTDIINGQENVGSAVDIIYGQYLDGAEKVLDGIVDIVKAVDKDSAEDTEAAADSLKKSFATGISNLTDLDLPGGKRFMANVGSAKTSGGEQKSKIDIPGLEVVEDGPDAAADIEAPIGDDIKELTKAVHDNAEKIADKKKAYESMEKSREKAMDAINKYVDDVDKGRIEGTAVKVQFQIITRIASGNLAKPIGQVSHMAFNTGRYALSIAEDAVKNLKDAE